MSGVCPTSNIHHHAAFQPSSDVVVIQEIESTSGSVTPRSLHPTTLPVVVAAAGDGPLDEVLGDSGESTGSLPIARHLGEQLCRSGVNFVRRHFTEFGCDAPFMTKRVTNARKSFTPEHVGGIQ